MSGKSILAAIDLQHSESDAQVAAEALGLAQSHNAALHIVFVIPDQQHSYVQNYVSQEMKAQVRTDADKDLRAFADDIDNGNIAIKTHVRRGSVYEQVINLSNDIGADFVVVGSNRPGLKDLFIGPNAARIARHADCSVMVVRPVRNA